MLISSLKGYQFEGRGEGDDGIPLNLAAQSLLIKAQNL